MGIDSFKDLDVWKKAVELSIAVYACTKSFPKEEAYGLMSQMRRAAVSIPSNIAEGKERQSLKEYVHFLNIAKGSCGELETQVIISREINYIDDRFKEELLERIDHVKRMLICLMKALRKSVNRTP